MKILKNILKLSFVIVLASCTVSEKNWHEAASKINGQSIYIKKDGTVSAKIDNKLSNYPKLNIFDSNSADIGYGAMQILYREHYLEYANGSDKVTDFFILDLRNTYKSVTEYYEIISDKKSKQKDSTVNNLF